MTEDFDQWERNFKLEILKLIAADGLNRMKHDTSGAWQRLCDEAEARSPDVERTIVDMIGNGFYDDIQEMFDEHLEDKDASSSPEELLKEVVEEFVALIVSDGEPAKPHGRKKLIVLGILAAGTAWAILRDKTKKKPTLVPD